MNYGYECEGWTLEARRELVERLVAIVNKAEYVNESAKKTPAYIETDGPYSGVRIRRMTWMTDASFEYVITEADKAFDEIAAKHKVRTG